MSPVFIKKTTHSHYNKYANYAARLKEAGVDVEAQCRFVLMGRDLVGVFTRDEHLNNVPMQRFDQWHAVNRRHMAPGFSLAENICVMKHVLIYQMLGATPEFIDEGEPCPPHNSPPTAA